MRRERVLFGAAILAALVLGATPQAWATSVTWDATTDMTWDTTTANWTGDATTYTDGDTVNFGTTGAGTVNLSGTLLPGNMTVIGGNYVFDSTNGTLGSAASPVSMTIAANAYPANTVTFSNAYISSATLNYLWDSSEFQYYSPTVNISNTNIGSAIVNGGTFYVSGASTITSLTVSGTNTGGNVNVAAGANLHVGAYGGGFSSSKLSGGSSATAMGTLTVGEGDASSTFAGRIMGSGSSYYLHIVKVGSGTWTVTGNSCYLKSAPGVELLGGTLEIARPDSLAFGTNTTYTNKLFIDNAATLKLNSVSVAWGSNCSISLGSNSGGAINVASGVNFAMPAAITGGSAGCTLTKTGDGTLSFTSAKTYQGGTQVNAGVLNSAYANLPTTGVVTVNNGGTFQADNWSDANLGAFLDSAKSTWNTGSTLALNNSSASTVTTNIIGSMTLSKLGSGVLTLTGANTYSGGTKMSTGTINFANGSLGSTGVVQFNGNSTLAWASGNTDGLSGHTFAVASGVTATLNVGDNDVVLAAAGTGSGAVTKAGAGKLTLAADNTYIGTTTVGSGTLQLGNGGAAGSVVGDIALGANALVINRSDTVSFNNAITGTGTITKIGDGVVKLTNTNNAYQGATIVNGGELVASNNNMIGTTGGGVDIQSGKMSFDYSTGSAPDVQSILAAGYASGFTTGQLKSTTAGSGIGLGWMDVSDPGEGTFVVTVMRTYYGDANLDGSTDFTDLTNLLSHYNQTSGGIWSTGDFNYDGSVDFTDLTTLLSNYNASLGSAHANVAVPEPSTLLLSLAGLAGLLAYAWRKRK